MSGADLRWQLADQPAAAWPPVEWSWREGLAVGAGKSSSSGPLCWACRSCYCRLVCHVDDPLVLVLSSARLLLILLTEKDFQLCKHQFVNVKHISTTFIESVPKTWLETGSQLKSGYCLHSSRSPESHSNSTITNKQAKLKPPSKL